MAMDDAKGKTDCRTKVSYAQSELSDIKRAAASSGMSVSGFIREITVRGTATVMAAVRRTRLAISADQKVILSDLGRILSAADLPLHLEIEIVECLARLEISLQADGEDETKL